jgi:phosphoenolpyruvate carboxylase
VAKLARVFTAIRELDERELGAESLRSCSRTLRRRASIGWKWTTSRVPPLLSFGSWIGGDRDGNPNVTAAVTLQTLGLMRRAALAFLERRVARLAKRVSVSSVVTGPARLLEPALEAGAERFPQLADELARRNPEEPYRRCFVLVSERLRATCRARGEGYPDAAEFLADPAPGRECAACAAGRLDRRRRPARRDPRS